jgi:hypothetical protein
MRERLVAAVVLVGAALTVVPLFASANHAAVRDSNDTKGVLDVRRVAVKGKRERPKWQVVTFSGWSAASVWDQGYGLVYLDTFGEGRFDYYALVLSNGYSLNGTLWRDRKKKADYRVAKLHVARANRRSFTVKIPLGKLKIPDARLTYRWYAETIVSSGACPRSCLDRAPDSGAVTEPVPGREPPTTPPPTIVPSLTVTPRASASPSARPPGSPTPAG